MTPTSGSRGPRAGFSCECRTGEGTTVITVSGEVDIVAADRIQDYLVRDGLGPDGIRLDLGGVTFMGVAGLAVLLHAADLCRDHGMDLTLVASPEVTRVVKLIDATSGLVDHLIPVGADPR
ncbi:anti-sigma factor antagonist [Saccharothrix texasensis]|uniref:Anti-sigma factor antagonist n=1 Tax=Saccharothrix texasensis TaxID=103734 RepID=A0A3N1HJJ9_9PSEU|nr:anti-sigma factor antagonist [Saccharothrix texasensis]ROP42615.1 anti-anti-sigma factor [Saccharothrix texasensis]